MGGCLCRCRRRDGRQETPNLSRMTPEELQKFLAERVNVERRVDSLPRQRRFFVQPGRESPKVNDGAEQLACNAASASATQANSTAAAKDLGQLRGGPNLSPLTPSHEDAAPVFLEDLSGLPKSGV